MKLNLNLRNFPIYGILILIILGHFSLVLFNINISSFFDFVIIGLLIVNFKLKKQFVLSFFIIASIVVFFLFRIPFTNLTWDFKYFFISYKLLIYLLLFLSYSPQNSFNKTFFIFGIKSVYIVSIILIFSDKIVSIFLLGPINGLLFRPRLIGEINFDIVLLLELWVLLKLFDPDYKKYLGFSLFLLVLISLSRSGIIGYVFTYFFVKNAGSDSFDLKKVFRNLSILFFGFLLILLIYYLRDPNLDFKNIDRVQLFNALFSIYDINNIHNLFVGHGVLVQLPDSICDAFSYYAQQTTGNSDNCNPVILFSYYLRSIYEFGILVTLILPFLYFRKISYFFKSQIALAIMCPVISVSLAVGGFYNGVAILSLILAINLKN